MTDIYIAADHESDSPASVEVGATHYLFFADDELMFFYGPLKPSWRARMSHRTLDLTPLLETAFD